MREGTICPRAPRSDNIRSMTNIRIDSVSEPFTDPRSGTLAARIIAFAATVNMMPSEVIRSLDLKSWQRVLTGLRKAGLAQLWPVSHRADAVSSAEFAAEIGRLYETIVESPVPDSEWGSIRKLLGDDLLEKLLHVSRQSIHRYASGERRTPQDVAERLHVLALIASDLSGSYNEFGIRRWFERPRAELGGRSPAALLKPDWKPGHEAARKVRSLAAELIGAGAT